MNRVEQRHAAWGERLRGLAATIGLIIFVAGAPLAAAAVGKAPWDVDLSQVAPLLSSPDDGHLFVAVFAVGFWAAWAVGTVLVLVAVVAEIRGIPAPNLPGLALPQAAAGQLVAMAALLFVATPTLVAAFPAAPAPAATPNSVSAAIASAVAAPDAITSPTQPTSPNTRALATTHARIQAQTTEPRTFTHVSRRGEGFWKIAERYLGNGRRFEEIKKLNPAIRLTDAGFLPEGTPVRVPIQDPALADLPAENTTHTLFVEAGDTLSEIALEEDGNAADYPDIFQASQNIVQPNGYHLTDPNKIYPGERLVVPDESAPDTHVASQPEHTHTPTHTHTPSDVTPPKHIGTPAAPSTTPTTPPTDQTTTNPTQQPTPEATPPASDSPSTPAPSDTVASPSSQSSAGTPDEADGLGTPGWLVPGLAGAGAVLAALVLIAVRAHRNTQLRYRRPGQRIAPPPPELRAIEKTAFVAGAPITATIGRLDRALRLLAGVCEDEGRPLPVLTSVRLRRSVATLYLGEAADLPHPWTGAGREWSLAPDVPVQDRYDVVAPYPLLVTVGQDENDALLLVNLEQLGFLHLAEDPEASAALARHIAAELALNPWSVLVDVAVIGLGEELATLDPLRLRHFDDATRVVGTLTQDLASVRTIGSGDPDTYQAIVTGGDGTSDLARLLSTPGPRLGAAAVSLAAPVPGATIVQVDSGGQLRAPVLGLAGLKLKAAGLTADEAAACAAIVDLTRDSEPVPVPAYVDNFDGWRALADQAGALRSELTVPREEGPAGDGSLLPNSADDYTEVAATTPEDVAALAPVVAEEVRVAVEEADPGLDEDVAAWFDPDSRRARLTLLGPVNARAFGATAPAIAKRKPYFVEMLAFLALHPAGSTGSAVAEAFGIATSRARTDLGTLREWLGENPRTGTDYLPQATRSRAYEETGVRAYQVEDVLADVDLFRRLRARGQARGATGITDLMTALRLVQGVPFTNLRERGWGWLLDSERLHETIGCAIVDVAHVLVTGALQQGDLVTARAAAETGCMAAPHDDICRLDLVKVAAAEGHEEAAERMLTDDVFNRTDDQLPPIDLPDRTGEVVTRQGWARSTARPTD